MQLLGEWYSYARRKGTIGIDSSKFLITRGDPYGSKLLMFYAGLRYERTICVCAMSAVNHRKTPCTVFSSQKGTLHDRR